MAAHAVRWPQAGAGALYRQMLPAPQGLSHDSFQQTIIGPRWLVLTAANASTSRRSRLGDVQKPEHWDTCAACFPTMHLPVLFFPSAVSGGEGSSGLDSAGSRVPAPGRRHTTPTGPVPRRRGTDPHHRSHNIQDPSLDLSCSLYVFMSLFTLVFPCRAVRAVHSRIPYGRGPVPCVGTRGHGDPTP